MAKRKKRVPPEVRAEEEARYAETTRLLEERIAYHRAKIAEERERKARRPWWRLWRAEA
ncbi:MAG: hypothetical protein H0U82_06270 [Actinobacteria bacterium]|nr:hypothetical protein [Actinomycetota bacterium]